MRQGDWEGAKAATQAALLQVPTNPHLHAYLGICFFRQNRFEEAEPCFRRASTLDPGFWQAGAKHAQCLYQLRRREEAYQVAKHWSSVNPNDNTLRGLIHTLQHQVRGTHQEGWERTRGLGYKIERGGN
jgi:Flp pilus assembly protein TadD